MNDNFRIDFEGISNIYKSEVANIELCEDSQKLVKHQKTLKERKKKEKVKVSKKEIPDANTLNVRILDDSTTNNELILNQEKENIESSKILNNEEINSTNKETETKRKRKNKNDVDLTQTLDCYICGAKYLSKTALVTHIKTKHQSDERAAILLSKKRSKKSSINLEIMDGNNINLQNNSEYPINIIKNNALINYSNELNFKSNLVAQFNNSIKNNVDQTIQYPIINLINNLITKDFTSQKIEVELNNNELNRISPTVVSNNNIINQSVNTIYENKKSFLNDIPQENLNPFNDKDSVGQIISQNNITFPFFNSQVLSNQPNLIVSNALNFNSFIQANSNFHLNLLNLDGNDLCVQSENNTNMIKKVRKTKEQRENEKEMKKQFNKLIKDQRKEIKLKNIESNKEQKLIKKQIKLTEKLNKDNIDHDKLNDSITQEKVKRKLNKFQEDLNFQVNITENELIKEETADKLKISNDTSSIINKNNSFLTAKKIKKFANKSNHDKNLIVDSNNNDLNIPFSNIQVTNQVGINFNQYETDNIFDINRNSFFYNDWNHKKRNYYKINEKGKLNYFSNTFNEIKINNNRNLEDSNTKVTIKSDIENEMMEINQNSDCLNNDDKFTKEENQFSSFNKNYKIISFLKYTINEDDEFNTIVENLFESEFFNSINKDLIIFCHNKTNLLNDNDKNSKSTIKLFKLDLYNKVSFMIKNYASKRSSQTKYSYLISYKKDILDKLDKNNDYIEIIISLISLFISSLANKISAEFHRKCVNYSVIVLFYWCYWAEKIKILNKYNDHDSSSYNLLRQEILLLESNYHNRFENSSFNFDYISHFPLLTNNFLNNFLLKNEYFALKSEEDLIEIIEMVRQICIWLYENRFTEIKINYEFENSLQI
jgi:hypothetical protein